MINFNKNNDAKNLKKTRTYPATGVPCSNAT